MEIIFYTTLIILFYIAYWILKDIRIEGRYANTLLEEQNELLKEIKNELQSRNNR